MIERNIVAERLKEFEIKEYISDNLKKVGHSYTTLQRTPLGHKIIIYASRPGLIVGRQGESIKRLTNVLKERFSLDNPQIEVGEIKDVYLDPHIVAEMISNSLERFGSNRFKGIMHQMLDNVLKAGARGVEIILSGKLPSKRARSWRVYGGYLKKSGDCAIDNVKRAKYQALLKSGTVGIKVSIMPPDVELPDYVEILETPVAEKREGVTETKEGKLEAKKEDEKPKKPRSRKRGAKKAEKTEKAPRKRKVKEEGEKAETENGKPAEEAVPEEAKPDIITGETNGNQGSGVEETGREGPA